MLMFAISSVYSKDIDLDSMFKKYNFSGSFVLLDNSADEYYYYNHSRCLERFTPASTFKIPNSIIGVETGILTDVDYIFKYNGEDRWRQEWRQDLTLREAMKYSCVPCYQELARKIGRDTMQYWLDKFNYGNKQIGDQIDEFWLNGSIQISQVEQIEFLKKFYFVGLGVSSRTTDIVKSILVYDKNDKFTLSGKTGTSIRDSIITGWYVGYIEKSGKVYFFALNIEHREEGDLLYSKERVELTYAILRYLKIIE